jgi:hypothetical protein
VSKIFLSTTKPGALSGSPLVSDAHELADVVSAA